MSGYRVGLGFDVHRLRKSKRPLMLAGIKVPSAFSLDAVSDGDVVLHAIADAFCGAIGLGDIGDYFPPQAESSKNIDSKHIVKQILRPWQSQYRIINIDVTVVTDKPRLLKYKKDMKFSLIKLLGAKNINIKLKSKEGLDILGANNAISCFATVLLKKC